MTTRIPTRGKQAFNGQFDITRYVYCCLGCAWQVQAGYRARSDVGGARSLFECFAQAHIEHIKEAHPDPIDVTVDWDDNGPGHQAGTIREDGSSEAALMAVRMPEWWVDR